MQQQPFNPIGQGQQAGQGQQMGQAMQQNRMPQPPQIVTTKDLLYIKDALSWELDVIKKFNHFSQEAQDQKVKNLIKQASQMHQKHYQVLLKHLNPANSANRLQS